MYRYTPRTKRCSKRWNLPALQISCLAFGDVLSNFRGEICRALALALALAITLALALALVLESITVIGTAGGGAEVAPTRKAHDPRIVHRLLVARETGTVTADLDRGRLRMTAATGRETHDDRSTLDERRVHELGIAQGPRMAFICQRQDISLECMLLCAKAWVRS